MFFRTCFIFRDVGAFSKVRPRLLQLRFGVSAPKNHKKIIKNHQKVYSQKPRNSRDVWTWMRLCEIFPDSAIVYGVAPWVGWKESTVVRCVLIVYAHSPVPIVLAGKYFSRSARRLRSTTRSDEKSELEKIENH